MGILTTVSSPQALCSSLTNSVGLAGRGAHLWRQQWRPALSGHVGVQRQGEEMQDTGKVFYRLICVNSHTWNAEAHSLTCPWALTDSGLFFCLQSLGGVLCAAIGHWWFGAGSFLTWVTSVTNVSLLLLNLEPSLYLQGHPSSFPLHNLQTQIFCSTLTKTHVLVSIHKGLQP